MQTQSTAYLGPLFTVLKTVTGFGELKVFHVKPESIVVPGLAGRCLISFSAFFIGYPR
jgi:hypothetical protein